MDTESPPAQFQSRRLKPLIRDQARHRPAGSGPPHPRADDKRGWSRSCEARPAGEPRPIAHSRREQAEGAPGEGPSVLCFACGATDLEVGGQRRPVAVVIVTEYTCRHALGVCNSG